MSTSRRTGDERTWRRRLLPAAPLFMLVWAAVLLASVLGQRDAARPPEPDAGRRLPAAALAGEHEAAPRARAVVDVVDGDAPAPQRVTIPAIGVSARMAPLGLAEDGTMETPERWEEAGWFEPGHEPGERGPAVIAGHVDSTRGPAVFYRLRELRRGDLVRIRRADGSTVRFRVKGLERWPKAAFPTRRVFRPTRIATLRLVTCSGDFDASTGPYVDNTIVYAVRVPVHHAAD